MAWLRLDDGFAQHPKIVALTPRDRWTWLELLSYCARYRTDGRVPAGIAEVVRGCTPAFLDRCAQLRLLDPVPGTTSEYQVHDWQEYNPPRLDDLDEAVAAFLHDNPQASANTVWKSIGGSRNGVLAAVRRYRSGTEVVPEGGTENGTSTGIARASRPVPSPSTTTAAADTTNGTPPAAAANGAAAASIYDRLEGIGISTLEVAPGVTDAEALAAAWLDLAEAEAHTNPAGFVIAGVRSGQWPSPRVRAQDQALAVDQPARRERFVRGDGWRLPPDELEFQLGELGAADDELVELLDLAADLRAGAAA